MESHTPSNFIEQIIEQDIKIGKNKGRVHTRFPPEPNGHLHIGHAKSICLNFGIAQKYNGYCNLRFDDTNPEKESAEYVEAIKDYVRWLGFERHMCCYASDYFGQFYYYAIQLIEKKLAYVCSLSAEEIRHYRGTLTEAGTDSPYRERSISENLTLFEKMRKGVYEKGTHVLRAKIDMKSPNLNMRDPIIYRIQNAEHSRFKKRWHIYPTYDFSHCISDAIERITHSLCTLEFEDHRPLYDWFLDKLGTAHPQQIEFARLQLNYTISSKRKIKLLIDKGLVDDWDDPRLMTLSGMRRRGVPPKAIRDFCSCIGLTKKDSWIDFALFENCVRDTLNKVALRRMAVVKPLKVIILNYPEGKVEYLDAANNPNDEKAGTRPLAFSRELYIDYDDFSEDPPKKFFRLARGREVRLKYAYYITCVDLVKDKNGKISELHCRYDPQTRGGGSADQRKVKGTIHWLSAAHAKSAEIRLYDRLFNTENPLAHQNIEDAINLNSLITIKDGLVEADALQTPHDSYIQFERLGYFCADNKDYSTERPVFNRTITLRDTWAKISSK
ncbi:MAG: glutamine--tRNA ligase/YqeY domain fusion protein [Chromatiales bacterium]|nr:glutamine--tRNA ligase/YqeY domain fusion protein [Chromatiales bacterium]